MTPVSVGSTSTLSAAERKQAAGPLLKLASQSLRRGRLLATSDFLELLYLADPTSKDAMLLRARLADVQGKALQAKAFRQVHSCL